MQRNWLVLSMVKAQELRAPAASARHLLLVLLDLEPSDLAHQALVEAKVNSDEIVWVKGRARRRGASASPALMTVDGFARGLATAAGRATSDVGR